MSRYADLLRKAEQERITWTPTIPDRSAVVPHGIHIAPASVPVRHSRDGAMPPPDTDYLRIWLALRKHWRLSAIFAASTMFTVLVVTLLTRPVYAPVARVEIDPPGTELFTMEGRNGSDNTAEYLETQARNMQSEELLVGVIRQLHLQDVPEITHRGFATRAISAVSEPLESLPARLWGEKKPSSVAVEGDKLQAITPAEEAVLDTVQGQLTVKRDTASRLVAISFSSSNPRLAATVTNTVVRSFIDRTYQTRHAAIMESTEWLSRQLDDIRSKMEDSNRSLSEFQRINAIADIDQNRSTFTAEVEDLSRQKMQAQAERTQLESYLKKARQGDAQQTLPQIQTNQVVQLLTQKLAETRAELSQTLAVYGKNHPYARKLQNQAEELESQIQLQRNAILGEMETSYGAALTREHMIDGQLRGTSKELGQMTRYAALKKEAEANTDLYNALYARVKEAGIAAASKSINIRIVDQAQVLTTPTRPRPLVNFGLGLLIAVVGGMLLAFGREAMDNKIHTPEDVLRYTGIASVSIVPIAGANGGAPLLTSVAAPRLASNACLDGPVDFLDRDPGSEQSEAFRGLHASVMLSRPGNPPRVLLVASSLPGEGKSTVAINLATALSQQGKTCILDADLRRPSLARSFHLEDGLGLGDYLCHSVPLESLLSSSAERQSLTIIVAGTPVTDPGKLINSEQMRAFVRTLRRVFDFVVIDSPPILPYADGRALAPFVDGVVFVGRAGLVTRTAIARSMQLLDDVHSAPILEIVLNGAHSESQSYGYYKYKYNR